jgi:hypothetical protein
MLERVIAGEYGVRAQAKAAVLGELGAPLLAETYGTPSPRPGMMRI